ncbi:MAG: MBL fold metallo-hydrolase [Polyangiaceae bacterium]
MNDDKRRHGLRAERTKASHQFRDGTFHNAAGDKLFSAPGAGVMAEFFFRKGRREPGFVLPVERPHEGWSRSIDSGLRVTWLGHSTVLLEVAGRRILTDPVFGDRASPFNFAGPKRFHPVPAALSELPELDVVLLSHDHFDHLCRPTMEALAKTRVPIVTALGVGAHLEAFGIDPSRITELDWHESMEVAGVHFTALPAQHFSGRGLLDRNRTLWASWAMRAGNRSVYFSGDTGLFDEMHDIGLTNGPFDLVLLEIGAFHPSWGAIHLGPENALTAFERLRGKALLPVHWSTFNLGLHDWDDPGETLFQLAEKKGSRILTPKIGAVFEPDHAESPEAWWRPLIR